MLNTLVLNPVNNRKVKKAPMDMAIKGFHLRGYPQTNDTWAINPAFTLKVNYRNRLDNLPCSPFVFPFYFDMPMAVEKNSELELEYIVGPTGGGKQIATDANPPQLVIEWEPLDQVKRHGNTMMKHFRATPTDSQVMFDLFKKYHVSVLSSFVYEDNNAGALDDVAAFPAMNTTNSFVLKYQINQNQDVRLIDEGQVEWWRYGHWRRFYTDAGGSMLPQVFRRRYWPGILIKPDFEFFMDRQLPAAGLTAGTNFVFEFAYMTPEEFAKLSQVSKTAPRL